VERLLRIESLVHGGDGLARDEGRVVFVPLTVPGDLARVEVTHEGSVGRGRLLDVVEPGASRRDPPCPLVGTCGGCQWQQVTLAEQQRAKQEHVRDALSRMGGFSNANVRPTVASPQEWRYRRRLRAHLTPNGWGYARRASHAVVDVAACLLVEPEVERVTHEVARALHDLGLASAVETFAIDVVGQKAALHIASRKTPTGLRKKLEQLDLAGIMVTQEGATPLLLGQPALIDPDHRRLRVRPDLFAQANRLGARLLAQATAASVDPGTSVLEIFAGGGTLTLYFAGKTSRLVATEGEGPSLDLLRSSLRDNGWSAQLIAGPAARVVGGLAKGGESFDQIVLDPPRTGAKEIMADVARLARRRITYVSCDPATLGRDAGMLGTAGWRLVEATPFDLFPHTHHVETVAVFER
jgi:23S rRNA (uracil1939-C5)-methyltransferase